MKDLASNPARKKDKVYPDWKENAVWPLFKYNTTIYRKHNKMYKRNPPNDGRTSGYSYTKKWTSIHTPYYI